jgi:hypothetical protein
LYETIGVEPDATLTHYPHKKYCENFAEIIKGYKPIIDEFKKKLPTITIEDQGLLKKADDIVPPAAPRFKNVGTSKIDLNDLFAKLPDGKPAFANEDQCAPPAAQCKRPGYVVVVRTPIQNDNCKFNKAALTTFDPIYS